MCSWYSSENASMEWCIVKGGAVYREKGWILEEVGEGDIARGCY